MSPPSLYYVEISEKLSGVRHSAMTLRP